MNLVSGMGILSSFFFATKGSNWKSIEGYIEGQTATCRGRFDGHVSFVHPIDVHLSCRGIQGWPKVHVEVYAVNSLNHFFPVG